MFTTVVGVNHAYRGVARQSSTFRNSFANKSIDGKLDQSSCSMTKFESNPWWSVTFINVMQVHMVTIAGMLLFHLGPLVRHFGEG